MKRRVRLGGIVLLAISVVVGLAAGDVAAKKKKHKKTATTFSQSVAPNAAIADAPPTGDPVQTVSTITVGKKFKGKQVGDVNVTGIQITGSASGAASDVNFSLSGPTGRTLLLLGTGIGDTSIGPLTLDDDTPTSICNDTAPTCTDPDATLLQPFAGTSNLIFLRSGDTGPLSVFNHTPMKGTWTFRIWDNINNGDTDVLNSWGLQITAARPIT